MSAVQVAPNQLTVSDGEGPMELCSDTQLRGIALDGQQVVIWGTKRVNVYELNQRHFKVVGSFACECLGAVILEHTLYCIEGSNVQASLKCCKIFVSSELFYFLIMSKLNNLIYLSRFAQHRGQ